jgi:hypothetical protein
MFHSTISWTIRFSNEVPAMRLNIILLIIGVLAVSLTAPADTILVPADQPTIQAGIDAAVNGDTVLVADGTYTGDGNRDIDFLGKAITVRSEHGPERCIIDIQGSETDQHRGFIFQTGERRDAVLQGFTIRGGNLVSGQESGAGLECRYSSPTIRENLITGNLAMFGGGISIYEGSPLIVHNRIIGNHTPDEPGTLGVGAGIFCIRGGPVICGNFIADNHAGSGGGGIYAFECDMTLVNNLITGNKLLGTVHIDPMSGGPGVYCDSSVISIVNCTITRNRCDVPEFDCYGGGICIDPPSFWGWGPPSVVTVQNSIIRGNLATSGEQCHVGTSSGPSTLSLDHSNLAGGQTGIHHDWGILYWGVGMIEEPALFSVGPVGTWYLSQIAAGQPVDSPCLDTGGADAGLVCYDTGSGTICLDQLTTRTDNRFDTGTVDMGFHYPRTDSVTARLETRISSGVLPISTPMRLVVGNRFTDQRRRMHFRIDAWDPAHNHVPNWRTGYATIRGGEDRRWLWRLNIPAHPNNVGEHTFIVWATDVTPAPFNQPPYPPSGDTDIDQVIVTGIAP